MAGPSPVGVSARDAESVFPVTTSVVLAGPGGSPPGPFGVVDDRHVRLPRIGILHTKEPTTKLMAALGAGTTRVLSATISERAERWYVSFGCQVDRKQRPAPSGPPVGVDAGVKSLAVLSSGEVVPNPKHLSKWARRQARLQRQCARRAGPAKGRAPSKRWWRSKARLARTHAKVATAPF